MATVADSLVGRRRVVTGNANCREASSVGYDVYCHVLAKRARPTLAPTLPLGLGWIPDSFCSSVITSNASGAYTVIVPFSRTTPSGSITGNTTSTVSASPSNGWCELIVRVIVPCRR